MPYALGPILGLVLLGASPIEQPQPGKLVEHVSCPADPSQTFSLYLPSPYVTTRRWPLLLVFDPGGRGARAAEVFREAAERYGWIVAASENARNGPWEPTLRAVNAMWPALLGGYAVDERRVYTAGHSGGASVAWIVAQQTGQIAGVIASGQPNNGADRGKAQFAWFGAAGHADFNFLEVKSIDEQLAKSGATRRVEFFDGGHQWPPADLTLRALGWMEVVAMKEGRRPRDVAFASSILAEDMARARGLEDRGLLTEAWQSYRSIADSYSGLVEIADATARKRAIEADARFKNLRKLEERTDRREREAMSALGQLQSKLTPGSEPVLPGPVRVSLDLDALEKAARGDSYDAASARRSLALIRVQLSSLVRDLEARHDRRAAILRTVLDSIK